MLTGGWGVSVFSFLFVFLTTVSSQAVAEASGFNLELSKQRCTPAAPGELVVYNSDFKWSYTLPEMAQRFREIYNSGKRLDARAYYDRKTNQFYLTHRGFNTSNKVKIDENFIKSVTRHVEVALEQKYAEFIFFPDMGHSHLYFEEKHWNDYYSVIPEAKEIYQQYEKMYGDLKMRALYHTAEQLHTKSKESGEFYSDHLEFRFWHRNLVGDNSVPDVITIFTDPNHAANSVGDMEGHHAWSAGYSISSSKNGCFAYKQNGKTLYFDISIHDLPADPDAPVEYM